MSHRFRVILSNTICSLKFIFHTKLILMPNSQQKAISRIVKGMKWGAGALFMAANIFLAYKFSTAYSSGQQRAQKLHKERQDLKSSGKQSKVKITMPQQTQPEYVEKQVRKYKQLYANSKQKQQRP